MLEKIITTPEMIITAGFAVVQKEGIENLNASRIASELKCFSQAVKIYYKTTEELKNEIHTCISQFFVEYIMRFDEKSSDKLLAVGQNYLRFAHEEKHLFRALFQTDGYNDIGLDSLLNSEKSESWITSLFNDTGLTTEQAQKVIETLFFCVHGIASLLANDSMKYDEEHCIELLKNTFNSTVGYIIICREQK